MDRKKLVNQSIDYIMQHLEEDLSLDTVSAHFYISKYHFSRIFKEETGESIYSFIKRCRVDQSAVDMKLNPAKAITDIGLDYGYSSSNYSSVFKKRHDISPTAFKQSICITGLTGRTTVWLWIYVSPFYNSKNSEANRTAFFL